MKRITNPTLLVEKKDDSGERQIPVSLEHWHFSSSLSHILSVGGEGEGSLQNGVPHASWTSRGRVSQREGGWKKHSHCLCLLISLQLLNPKCFPPKLKFLGKVSHKHEHCFLTICKYSCVSLKIRSSSVVLTQFFPKITHLGGETCREEDFR